MEAYRTRNEAMRAWAAAQRAAGGGRQQHFPAFVDWDAMSVDAGAPPLLVRPAARAECGTESVHCGSPLCGSSCAAAAISQSGGSRGTACDASAARHGRLSSTPATFAPLLLPP